MSDLDAFLRARLVDDAVRATMREVHARDCEIFPENPDGYTYPCECGVPERMMREVEAKRKIIDLHWPYVARQGGHAGEQVCAAETPGDDEFLAVPWPCDSVRALAAVYSDHPDYDEGWA